VEANLPRPLILGYPKIVLDRNPPSPLVPRLRDDEKDWRRATQPVFSSSCVQEYSNESAVSFSRVLRARLWMLRKDPDTMPVTGSRNSVNPSMPASRSWLVGCQVKPISSRRSSTRATPCRPKIWACVTFLPFAIRAPGLLHLYSD